MREKKEHWVRVVPNGTLTFFELEDPKNKMFQKGFPTLLLCVMAFSHYRNGSKSTIATQKSNKVKGWTIRFLNLPKLYCF